MGTKAKKTGAAADAATATAAVPETVLASPMATTRYQELADLGRANVAALLRANAALSEGFGAMSKEMLGFARSSFESAATATTAMLSAKTLDDVLQANSAYTKASVDLLIARSSKLSAMGAKVASEALAPLGARVEATLQKFGKPSVAA